MDLSQLYSLRKDFVIIGLTGRTGSGSTKIAELLAGDFSEIKKGLRDERKFDDAIFARKYKICKDYLSYKDNWVPFEIIKYRDVLTFYFLSEIGNDYEGLKKMLLRYYNETKEESKLYARILIKKVKLIHDKYSADIINIHNFKDKVGGFKNVSKKEHLEKLHYLFFESNFKTISDEINNAFMSEGGYFRRVRFFHHVASNIRKHGTPFESKTKEISKIYTIAHLINRLIKAKKFANKNNKEGEKPTKIVIDSLRNSLEIMFFKERYSGFYPIATKDTKIRAEQRLIDRFKDLKYSEDDSEKLTRKMLELDDVEYRTGDFQKGKFSAPDVENCIQKSDIHIKNLKLSDEKLYKKKGHKTEVFFSREEQLLKIVSLISQPGIITPSALERNMHMAFVAKSNSGCISRQVGAVITNNEYSLKSIGWNDVAAGSTPCNLRSVSDFQSEEIIHDVAYSEFERGINIEESNFKYKKQLPFNFKNALQKYYNIKPSVLKEKLHGKNCPFCFKSVHNFYEDEKNQVHTRSLHAEENAMLQIAKYGGEKLKNGRLFTTASPCELCAKKAFQLGISKIYYIDPYPGISESHILKTGSEKNRLIMISFKGVIGKSYHKLYEPFMSYKDEINLMIDNTPEPLDIKLPKLSEFKSEEVKSMLKKYVKDDKISVEHLEKILISARNTKDENKKKQ